MIENAKVGSRISSTPKSTRNLLLDITEDAEIGGNGDDNDDKTVQSSLFYKKSNVYTRYLISLHFKKRWVSSNSFEPLLKLSIKATIRKALK